MLLSGAQCASATAVISAKNGQLALVNNSGKALVAYVLVDPQQRSTDGTPRIYTGRFSANAAVPADRSIVFDAGSSQNQITIDYVRFADGSSCGNGTTREAKAAGAH